MLRNKITTSLKFDNSSDEYLTKSVDPTIINIYNMININIVKFIESKQYKIFNSITIWYENNQLGIVINFDNKISIDDLILISYVKLIVFIPNIPDLQILAYKNNTYDSDIIYIYKNNTFDISNYKMSINSFRQPYFDISNLVNNMVRTELQNNHSMNFFGLGGECGLICKQNIDLIKKYYLITDNVNIYQDFLLNGFEQHYTELVKYPELDEKYWSNSTYDDWLLFVNISKTGLKHMAKYIKIFKKIVYIGCDKKTINSDIANLLNHYVLRETMQIMTNNFILIFDLKF